MGLQPDHNPPEHPEHRHLSLGKSSNLECPLAISVEKAPGTAPDLEVPHACRVGMETDFPPADGLGTKVQVW